MKFLSDNNIKTSGEFDTIKCISCNGELRNVAMTGYGKVASCTRHHVARTERVVRLRYIPLDWLRSYATSPCSCSHVFPHCVILFAEIRNHAVTRQRLLVTTARLPNIPITALSHPTCLFLHKGKSEWPFLVPSFALKNCAPGDINNNSWRHREVRYGFEFDPP
jgi:hypothetical protein